MITSAVLWTLDDHVICVLRRVVWLEIRAATAFKTCIWTGIVCIFSQSKTSLFRLLLQVVPTYIS